LALATGIAVAGLIPADAVGEPRYMEPANNVERRVLSLFRKPQKDNKPLYAERWQSTMTARLPVYSGQEIVTGRFSYRN